MFDFLPFQFPSPAVLKTFLCSFSSNIILLIKLKFSSLILLDALKAFPKISPCSLEHHICSSSLYHGFISVSLCSFTFHTIAIAVLFCGSIPPQHFTKINLLRNSGLPLIIPCARVVLIHTFPISHFFQRYSWYQFYNLFTSWRNPCCGNSVAFSVTHIKFFVLLSFEEALFLPIIWYLGTRFLSFLPPFCFSPFPTICFWLCLVYVFLSLWLFGWLLPLPPGDISLIAFPQFFINNSICKRHTVLKINFDFQAIYC